MITALSPLSRLLPLLSTRCWRRGPSMPRQWDITTSRHLTPPHRVHPKLSMHPSSTTRRRRYKYLKLGQHIQRSKMDRGEYPRRPLITHSTRIARLWQLLTRKALSTCKKSTSRRPILNTRNQSPMGRTSLAKNMHRHRCRQTLVIVNGI